MAADDLDVRVAMLAATLITARGAGDVQSAMTALENAWNILRPAPTNAKYKDWQSRNGLTPTTAEQDAEAASRKAANMASLANRLA